MLNPIIIEAVTVNTHSPNRIKFIEHKNKDLNIPFGLECVDRNVEQSQKETWKAVRKSGRE